ncbi:MAG: hypothetical protein AAFQ94_14540 [Bacteroidota bacterium]
MKKIHFDRLNGNWKFLLIIILSLLCIAFSFFKPIEFKNEEMYEWVSTTGFLLQVVFWLKMFWYRNYVNWNTKGINIRINSVLGKSLAFDRIKSIEIADKRITITKKDEEILLLNLVEFKDDDVERLYTILMSYKPPKNRGQDEQADMLHSQIS